jgi:hypothetical protein
MCFLIQNLSCSVMVEMLLHLWFWRIWARSQMGLLYTICGTLKYLLIHLCCVPWPSVVMGCSLSTVKLLKSTVPHVDFSRVLQFERERERGFRVYGITANESPPFFLVLILCLFCGNLDVHSKGCASADSCQASTSSRRTHS